MTSDPIGLAGGINTYGYVYGNPTNWVDDDGLSPRRGGAPYPRSRFGNPLGVPSLNPIGPRDPYRTRNYQEPIPKWLRSPSFPPSYMSPNIRPPSSAPGMCRSPKATPNFKPPTNPAQNPPINIPPNWRIREMPPTQQYRDGYWRMEKPTRDGWQPINPSNMKPGNRQETHVPFPPITK